MTKDFSLSRKIRRGAFSFLLGTVLFISVPISASADTQDNSERASTASASDISISDTSSVSTYKLADIDVQVSVSNDLVCFTQNVTSNNSYLELIGANDVEELRALMKVNNIYLEIIPRENVTYEILLSGKDAPSGVNALNELSEEDIQANFEAYVANSDNRENGSVTENVTNSFIERINGVVYYVTDITSVANNDVVIYLRKYYTIMQGKAISFSLQTNQSSLTDNMKIELENIVKTAEYKDIKKSIFDNPIYSEISATIITLLLPIGILALITFIIIKSTKRKTKKIS